MTPSAVPRADLDEVLARTRDLWEAVRGARIFITGGTGFFGRWLLESLVHADKVLSLDLSATVLTRSEDRFAAAAPHLAGSRALRFWRGDVRSFESPPGPFDHIVHAATVPRPPADEPAILGTILEGTERTLRFAGESGVRRFLLVSSGLVYGRLPQSPPRVTEDFRPHEEPSAPEGANATGKRAAERMAVAAGERSGFTVTIARAFALIGPVLPLDGQFAAGNFLRDALAGGPILVRGDGTPVRSYLYAADLAAWLWTIHFRGARGRAYNVGSEDEVSILGLARDVARAFEPARDVTVAGTPAPGRIPERYVPSTRRAREELGLDAWTSRPEAIRRTVAWHRGVGA